MDVEEVQVHDGPNAFDLLPIETNQAIASLLDSDKDLTSFTATCWSANDAVNGDNCSFWRRRFLDNYDRPSGDLTNLAYKTSYTDRQFMLRHPPKFKHGMSKVEKDCLGILIQMVCEAFSDPVPPGEISPNIDYLVEFMTKSNLSRVIQTEISMNIQRRRFAKPTAVNPVLQTIQVLMAPIIFAPHVSFKLAFRFPDSQLAVYAHAQQQRIFGPTGHVVDMQWLLHQLNFWQYHMTRREEFTLYDAFSQLPHNERPRFWTAQLAQKKKNQNNNKQLQLQHSSSSNGNALIRSSSSNSSDLGTRWKGSYAFVDRPIVARIRAGRGEAEMIQDEFNGEAQGGVFQDLTLNEVTDEAQVRWPAVFEQHLRSLALPEALLPSGSRGGRGGGGGSVMTRAQYRSTASAEDAAALGSRNFHFDGEGHDIDEDFLADGWLNPLPPQNGVPGWQRMTMMKYFLLDDDSIDYDALWAYEGVVLPGGQMIVGRWWSPNDGTGENMYSGPFILWCVDDKS